jgi:hypothetical protein
VSGVEMFDADHTRLQHYSQVTTAAAVEAVIDTQRIME